MLPIEGVIDYSKAGTPSENVSILEMNLYRRLPEPFTDDISTRDQPHFEALMELNGEYLSWSEEFRGIYELLAVACRECGPDVLEQARKALYLPFSHGQQSSQLPSY